MTWFDVYLFTRLDEIKSVFMFLSVAGFFIVFIGYILCFGFSGGDMKLKHLIYSIIFVAMSFIISSLIPTSKEAAAIYIIPKIANNEKFKDESVEMYLLAKKYLKSLVEEKTIE